MTDRYRYDEGAIAALAARLSSAEGSLAEAAGGDPDADAGQSTGALMAAAGLQAQSLSALSQALAKASAEASGSDTTYQDVEITNADGLAGQAE